MIYETEIFTFIFIIFIGFISACTTDFYDFCIGEPHMGEVASGRILSRLGYYLLERYEAHELSERKRLSRLLEYDIQKRKKLNWYKMLGVCPICCNFWISGLVGLLSCFLFSMPYWLILHQIFVSSRFLRHFMKI